MIFYDISEDAKRIKVANRLIEFGCYRIQRSVFVGTLKDKSVKELIQWLENFYKDALLPDDSIILLYCTDQQINNCLFIGAVPSEWSMATSPPNTLII
jgi:CRISPR-associated endonuclease Cas2